jgi:hypothetical protein
MKSKHIASQLVAPVSAHESNCSRSAIDAAMQRSRQSCRPPVSRQSGGQLAIVSPVSHAPLPQIGPTAQSPGQLVLSLVSQTPLPQTGATWQSAGQLSVDSPVSHAPLPHRVPGVQSAAHVSPVAQTPSPQTGAAGQSPAQLEPVSPVSHRPLPQTGHEAQTPTAWPGDLEQKSPGPQFVSLVHPGTHVGKEVSSQTWPAEQVATLLQLVSPERPAPPQSPPLGEGAAQATRRTKANEPRIEVRMKESFRLEDAAAIGSSRSFSLRRAREISR